MKDYTAPELNVKIIEPQTVLTGSDVDIDASDWNKEI